MSAFVALAVWPRRTGLVLVVAGLALFVALMLVGGRPGSAVATGPIDAGGTWDIQMAGDFGFTCDNASVMQDGTSISFQMACAPPANFSPSGTIDTTTGAFAASLSTGGGSLAMTGTVNKSGEEMSGSWTILIEDSTFEGTFTGSRPPPPPTATPTNTPLAPPPVGGIALDPDLSALPLETHEPSNNNTGLLAGIVAAVATGGLALAGVGWYAARQPLRN